MSNPIDRLNKLLQRFTDESLEEATIAFHQFRAHCQRHHISVSNYKLVQNERESLLAQYMAIIDRLERANPLVAELEETNRRLQAELGRLKARTRTVPKPRTVVQSTSHSNGDAANA